MTQGLSISRLIDVSVNLSPASAQFPNLSTLLVLGTSAVIDVVSRMRSYTSLSAVGIDFGTSAEEYKAAQAWFGQNPKPTLVNIGRWAKTDTHGQLIGGPVTAAHQLISYWAGISNGSFEMSIDGASAEIVTGLNFSLVTNLNGVASVINGVLTGAVVVWNSVYSRFEVTSNSAGANSSVSFAATHSTGTDISGSLALTLATGAYEANGIVAESLATALALFDNQFPGQWYAPEAPSATDNDHLGAAAYIEGASQLHLYGVNTQEVGVPSSSSTTDIAYLLKAGNYDRTTCQYSSTSNYAVASMLARILTTNWQGQNTAITLMYKTEPGITADVLTETQAQAIAGKNCNVFAAYNNNTAIIQNGQVSSGLFVDTIVGVDWLVSQIKTNVFSILQQTPTKIPQTDSGMNTLATAIASACEQAVTNGLAAPGVWNFQGFGQLTQGQFLSKGYYIYTPPVSQLSQADKDARKSVPFQIALILAGAVHQVQITLDVSQ